MYALTVFLGPACFQLLYRKEDKAREAKALLTPNGSTALGSTEWIQLIDDFGHEMSLERRTLSGFIYEDMEQTKVAHVERALHQQRLQNLAQKTAESDPGLRAQRMMGNGPVLMPFPGGMPNRGN